MLLRLLPELDSQATNQRTVSRSEHDCPLHLEVVARDRYTQPVRLTYEFTDETGVRRQPDLWVCLYRDASEAEPLHCNQRPPWDTATDATPPAHASVPARCMSNRLTATRQRYI